MENEQEKQEGMTPPYISFKTFLNALHSLTQYGVPRQIDASVLSKFAGSVQRQIYPALRFMDLIDEENRSTEKLRAFADIDEEKEKSLLKEIISSKFSNQIRILHDGTIQQLRNSFDYIKLEPSVKSKCITFFLKTAEYSGFEISPHIMKGRRVSISHPKKVTAETKKRRRGRPKTDQADTQSFDEMSRLKKLPIALGVDKVWFIEIEEDYNDEEIKKFTQMIELALLQKTKS